MFSNSNVTVPFGIFSTFPRALIGVEQVIAGIEGTLTVEEGEGMVDPLSLAGTVSSTSIFHMLTSLMCLSFLKGRGGGS